MSKHRNYKERSHAWQAILAKVNPANWRIFGSKGSYRVGHVSRSQQRVNEGKSDHGNEDRD